MDFSEPGAEAYAHWDAERHVLMVGVTVGGSPVSAGHFDTGTGDCMVEYVPRGDTADLSAHTREALDALDWYRRCLEDAQDGRRVTGFKEAKLGYDRALAQLREVEALRGAAVDACREALELIAEHARRDLSERGVAEAERYVDIAEDALRCGSRALEEEF